VRVIRAQQKRRAPTLENFADAKLCARYTEPRAAQKRECDPLAFAHRPILTALVYATKPLRDLICGKSIAHE
jgi:hypothetical protein